MGNSRIMLSGIVLATLGACGGDDLDSPSDAIGAAIDAQCDHAYKCKSSYDPTMNGAQTFEEEYGTSVADCVSRSNALITAFAGSDYLSKLDASADAGRINYSSSNASACLDASKTLTCDQFFEQNGQDNTEPPVCDAVLVGTVPNGAACTIDADCAADSGCPSATKVCTP